MIRSLVVLVFASTVAASVAGAATCGAAASQADLNHCAGQALAHADGRLNRAYAAALARLSADSGSRLREAQRAWLVFRDRQCAFESNGADGGSVAPMVAANCAAGLDDARTRALASVGRCAEGDVSCAR